MIAAIEAKKLAMVMISTSRCFTCDSSCAITPSSSLGESVRMIPVVQATVAFFCERPSAKAFGMSMSATAIFGLGRSAWMQSRSIIACSPGASSGETSLAPIADSASLSEKKSCANESAPMITTIRTMPVPAASSAHDQGHVEQPEQEQREQHPDLETRVAGEDRSLSCGHGRKSS